MRQRSAITLAAVLTIITLPAIHAATPDPAASGRPWLGTWTVVWPDKVTRTELRVDELDDTGHVTGSYCHRNFRKPWNITKLGGTSSVQPHFDGTTVRWEIPSRKGAPQRWEFTVERNSKLRMRFTNLHNRTHVVQLEKGRSQCLDRWETGSERPESHAVANPNHDKSDWLGTWVARWRQNQGQTEIRIDRIDDERQIHGAVCLFGTGRAKEIYDIGPDTDLQAVHRRNKFRFRVSQPDGTHGPWWNWRMTRKGLKVKIRGWASHNHLVFTQYTSRCLDHWRPLNQETQSASDRNES